MDTKESMAEMRDNLRALNKTIPEATKGFNEMQKAIKASGVLGAKEKEYVALGIAIAIRCIPCMEFHVHALMKAGGTREELGDICAMAMTMAGGPGLMYSAKVLKMWDDLAAEA